MNRMPSRKNRKSRITRKKRASRMKANNKTGRKNRKMRGGFMAPVGYNGMQLPMRDSLAQGNQYLKLHQGQYGGAPAPYPTAVTGSVLTGSMVQSARTGPLDDAISRIQGMQDGGKRRRKNKMTRKNKHRGGYKDLMGSSLSQKYGLLPQGLEKQAGLNNEWSVAKDPNFYAPK